MRILTAVLAVVVSTALMVGAVALVMLRPGPVDGAVVLATFSILVLVYAPLLLGSLVAYGNVRATPEARSTLRIWTAGIAVMEVLAGVAIVGWAVITGAPAWIPVVFIGGGTILILIALVVGRTVYRYDGRVASDEIPSSALIGAPEIRRKARAILVTFVAANAVAVTVAILVIVLFGADAGDVVLGAVLGLSLGFFAAAIATVVTSLPIGRRLRNTVGGGPARARRIAKVVLRGKDVDLSEDERVAAAEYAPLAAVWLRFQLVYLGLLFIGLSLQQLLIWSNEQWFSLVILGLLVVTFAVFAPLIIRQIRRARWYARKHPVAPARVP